ncbi:MAG: DUF1992 domain-containing protein [Mariprofundaceae bacterium]|nr:DUF1992 domain-containing protein [Mariprofundaceae bacterium]
MNITTMLAEQHIREAMRKGDFDHLEGEGRPLRPEADDPFVPTGLRMAYRILKHAGFVPPEVELRREIADIHDLIRMTGDTPERSRAEKRLQYLLTRLAAMRPQRNLEVERAYHDRLKSRLA